MKLILAPFGRCSTNSVSLAICLSCEESWIGEPFDFNLHDGKYSINKCGNVNNSIELLKNNNVTLIKHLYGSINQDDNLTLVDLCDSVIFLYRKHFVDQYISSFMCEQLALYRLKNNIPPVNKKDPHFFNLTLNHLLGKKEDKRYIEYLSLQRPPIDMEHLHEKFLIALQDYHTCKDILINRPKPHAIYSYEELYGRDTDNIFKEMCSTLGCSIKNNKWEQILSKKNKMFIAGCGNLIPNYDDVMSFREDLIIR